MGIIYQLIKNLRYLFTSKNIKRFLTIILIIILLFIANMQVFATDGSFGGGDGGGGFRTTYEPIFDNNIIQYINDAVYTYDNYNPLENNTFFFYDDNASSYRVVTWTGTDTGLYGYNEQTDYDVKVYNWEQIYLYTVNINTLDVTKVMKENYRETTFGTLFNLTNVFNKYNFMYACYKTGYQNSSVMDSYNNYYMKKTIAIEPFVKYQNNSFIIDDYIIINPASTRISVNSFIPFNLELWDADGGSIGDNVEYLSINLSTSSNYWDNENKYYKIPYTNYLKLWTSNDGNYELLINLFTNDHFYMKKNILSFTVENGSIVSPGGPGGPDNPSNPDYTENFNNMENAINGTTSAINETNNFLQDDTVDNTQFTLPSVEVADPTSNFFDTMFTGLYNAVTSDTDKTINLQLFGNNINVSSSYFNFLTDSRWSLLRSILSSVWVFGIGSYILKDIRKMIVKIKDGDVENMSNEDIKANMV